MNLQICLFNFVDCEQQSAFYNGFFSWESSTIKRFGLLGNLKGLYSKFSTDDENFVHLAVAYFLPDAMMSLVISPSRGQKRWFQEVRKISVIAIVCSLQWAIVHKQIVCYIHGIKIAWEGEGSKKKCSKWLFRGSNDIKVG